MAVLNVQISTTGQIPNSNGVGIGMVQQTPTIIYISTNDTLATVTTTGYLNESVTAFQYPYSNYQLAEVYTTDSGCVILRISITQSGGHNVYSLVAPSESGSITTPTVANQIAYATNTLGTLAAAGLTTALFNAGNISAGKSGTAGILESYPSAATSGKLELVGVANSGDFTVAISNASYGQSSTISFADVGSAAGRFLVANTATPFTSGHLVSASGTGGLTADAGIVAANVVTNSAAGILALPNALNSGSTFAVVVQDVVCSFSVLATGGSVTLLPSSGSKRYQILNIFENLVGTNFSGGGGDRLGQVTDGTNVFTVIPATNLQTLVNAGWGSTPVPYPASVSIDTLTAAGAAVTFKYSGGTTDYTAGSVIITIVAVQVA